MDLLSVGRRCGAANLGTDNRRRRSTAALPTEGSREGRLSGCCSGRVARQGFFGHGFFLWFLVAGFTLVQAQTSRVILKPVSVWLEPNGRPVHGVAVVNSYAFLAADQAGLMVLDVSSPTRPVSVARYPTVGPVVALHLAGNLALLAEGTDGLEWIDISDPLSPRRVGGARPTGNLQDVSASRNYACAIDALDGLRIVDISNPMKLISLSGLLGKTTLTPSGRGRLCVSGRYACLARGDAGVGIIDILDPALPSKVGDFDTPGEARGIAVVEGLAFVADGSAGLRIYSVSTPSNPVALGSFDTSGQANGVWIAGQYAFVADGPAGVQVIDVKDPKKPVWAGGVSSGGYASDLFVSGRNVFVAEGAKGLSLFSLSETAPGFAPKLALVPRSQTTAPATRTVMSTGATGTPSLHYQWFKNGLAMPRAEYPWLTIKSASATDMGNYWVAVSNAFGAITSSPVSLVVQGLPPVFLHDPSSVTIAEGGLLLLGARVLGWEPIHYQWHFNKIPLPRANDIRLAITNVQLSQSGTYFLIASNAFGVATSAVAQVRVVEPLRITQALLNTNLALGLNSLLKIETSGAKPLRIQWRLNGVNIPGATNETLSLTGIRAQDGGKYSVIIRSEAGVIVRDIAHIKLVLAEIPGADRFADRVLIRESDQTMRSHNVGATREAGEPWHAGKPGGRSIWYSWKAPASGHATFTTAGSDFDTLLAVYTGEQVARLTLEAGNDDAGGYLTSKAQFHAEAGQVYQIAVDGFAGAEGEVVLNWNLEPLLFAAPQIVQEPADQFVHVGGEARFSVVTKGRGLEYQWLFDGLPLKRATNTTLILSNVQPAQAGEYRVRISLKDRLIDSVAAQLEVYEIHAGDPGVLEIGQDKLEDLVLKVEAAGLFTGKLGALRRIGLMGAAPSSGYSVTRWGSTSGKTTQSFETGTCGQIGGSSQWFRLALSKPGICTLSTDGSNFDTLLAVFKETGDWMNPLSQPVACDDNSGPDAITSWLQFAAQTTGSYFVLVDGVDGANGTVKLTTTLEPWMEVENVGANPNGSFGFQLEAPKGWVFRIDGSTNLVEWLPLLSTNAPQGLLEFIDWDWDSFEERFYRIIPLP